MAGDDFALTAGWGHLGAGDAVMPGQGRLAERAAPAAAAAVLGATTFDIHLNDRAYWRNVPAAVWHYKLGGYQVLKKWLSYRDRDILGRPSASRKSSTSPTPRVASRPSSGWSRRADPSAPALPALPLPGAR